MIKISKLTAENKAEIIFKFNRAVNYDDDSTGLREAVANIINDVKSRGDAAVKDYELKFDKANLENLEVTQGEMYNAMSAVDPEFAELLKRAANNIRDFHARQVRNNFIVDKAGGVILGQRVIPLDKVGIYIPGRHCCLQRLHL